MRASVQTQRADLPTVAVLGVLRPPSVAKPRTADRKMLRHVKS